MVPVQSTIEFGGLRARRWPFVVAAFLSLWVSWVTGTAFAQRDPHEPRYEQGIALRSSHRDAEALALFRVLYDETHAPRALAQIALAEAALGEWVDAEAHLTMALAVSDSWVQRNRAVLDATQGTIQAHLGRLEVRSVTPGAALWIQNRRVASLPMAQPARVPVGTVTFEVRATGYVTAMRVATIVSNGFARESVDLAPETAPQPATVATPPPPARLVQPAPRASDVPAAPSSLTRTLGWTSAATAGAFLVGGSIAYVVGLNQVDSYNETCPPPDTPSLSPDCQGRVSSVQTMQALAITGFVGGGVLAAASAVLFLVAPSRAAERGAAALACRRGPGDLGVTCGVTF